jgi:hypothetical protein
MSSTRAWEGGGPLQHRNRHSSFWTSPLACRRVFSYSAAFWGVERKSRTVAAVQFSRRRIVAMIGSGSVEIDQRTGLGQARRILGQGPCAEPPALPRPRQPGDLEGTVTFAALRQTRLRHCYASLESQIVGTEARPG